MAMFEFSESKCAKCVMLSLVARKIEVGFVGSAMGCSSSDVNDSHAHDDVVDSSEDGSGEAGSHERESMELSAREAPPHAKYVEPARVSRNDTATAQRRLQLNFLLPSWDSDVFGPREGLAAVCSSR